MPVKVPETLPAVDRLKAENIFVMGRDRAMSQDIRPLRIAIVNLMPLKIMTETDLLRLLSNTPLQIELDLVNTGGHTSKNTPEEHIATFYKTFDQIRDEYYDGLIVTGAPVEKLKFEEVDYWPELTAIFDWARTHVTSTLYICWAAFAALYHFYSIDKLMVDKKISGVFTHTITQPLDPLFRGFDSVFNVPHSRFAVIDRDAVTKNPALEIMAENDHSGIYIIKAREGREFFITGHSEYSPLTLDFEYHRDLAKGLNPAIPVNYYPDDDPTRPPVISWRAHGNLLFANWLNYYVYQLTPYRTSDIATL